MKLAAPLDTASLVDLAAEAVSLLCEDKIDVLVDRFGYALSYGRDPMDAIKEDLRHSLCQVGANTLSREEKCPPPTVKYFKANSVGLLAVVECVVPTDNEEMLLIELIATAIGDDKYVTLEQISAVDGEHET